MLDKAGKALEPLLDRLVFVGGSIVGLLLTDPSAPLPRATQDVDVIVQVATRIEYYAIEKQFVNLGFQRNTESRVICRWNGHGLIVDLMPTGVDIIGFSNPWYESAMSHSIKMTLPSAAEISVVDAPHLLATKLVAFFARGNDDMYGSHDLEDIVLLLDGRPELAHELEQSPADLRTFVIEGFETLTKKPGFVEPIEGHLGSVDGAIIRRSTVLARANQIIGPKK